MKTLNRFVSDMSKGPGALEDGECLLNLVALPAQKDGMASVFIFDAKIGSFLVGERDWPKRKY